MVLLDKLVLELDRNGVLDMSARRRADSPTSSMMTPAPAEESRAVCSPTAISLWQLAEALVSPTIEGPFKITGREKASVFFVRTSSCLGFCEGIS
jgi:hypothetical protein